MRGHFPGYPPTSEKPGVGSSHSQPPNLLLEGPVSRDTAVSPLFSVYTTLKLAEGSPITAASQCAR